MIKTTSAVKTQSASAGPGIVTSPPSVVQVPMTTHCPERMGSVSAGSPGAQAPVPVIGAAAVGVAVAAGQEEQPATAGFFARRSATAAAGPVGPAVQTAQVGLNEAPAPQYDLMAALLHSDMFKVLSDMLWSETLRIQQGKSAKFGYLPMMAVATLKLVVSDLHVSLKTEEILMLVMFRMNHEFIDYMRASYPDRPLSEFKAVDTYVRDHGGVEALDDDEDDE